MENPTPDAEPHGLPGYPATAIEYPEIRSGGFLAAVYMWRGRIASAAVAVALAASAPAFVNVPQARTVSVDPSAFVPAETRPKKILKAVPSHEPRAEPLNKDSVATPAPQSFGKADPEKEARLERLEKALDGLETMIAQKPSVEPSAPALPRLDIKVTGAASSGFWRSEGKAEENFVVVEATGPDGTPAKVSVTDMDTGEVREVSRWAVRVTPEEFSRLSAEKAVSGSIGGMEAGTRPEGGGDIDWKLDVEGGALVDWKEQGQ